jgi:ABC-type Fe3+ transport system permease subunit
VSLGDAVGLARQSLDEVKAQTEYQDQKAGRLLTVSTILSAIAGLLFQRFNDAYPVQGTLDALRWSGVLVAAAYLAFAAFVFAVLCGALVTFHATRTRFKYEETEKPAADSGNPKSRLFYNPILGVRPRAWARAFVRTGPSGIKGALTVNPALQRQYFADLVSETYLVAAKTADKIRYLEEAQRLFAWALRCLLVWLLLLALVSIFVRSTRPDVKATKVQIEKMPFPASPASVRIDQRQPLIVEARVRGEPKPGGTKSGAGTDHHE